MSYANDPEWAWKGGYDPDRRQAYENQVMTDRAAAERHRAEFDAVAIVGGALAAGTWYATRADRKAAKASARARREYERQHKPIDYARRRMLYTQAIEQLEADYANETAQLQVEVNKLDFASLLAGSVKSERNITARLAAVKAMLEDKRLAYEAARDNLILNHRDILEYDARMELL